MFKSIVVFSKLAVVLALATAACDDDPVPPDAGVVDGGVDGPGDGAGPDLGAEAGLDAGPDSLDGEVGGDLGAETGDAEGAPDAATDGADDVSEAGDGGEPEAGAEVRVDGVSAGPCSPTTTARPLGTALPTAAAPGSAVRHRFEGETHGWADIRAPLAMTTPAVLAASAARASEGTQALEVAVTATANQLTTIGVNGATAPGLARLGPGMCVRFHLFVPSKAALMGVQAFMLANVDNSAAPQWLASGFPFLVWEALAEGQWNQIEQVVPDEVIPGRVLELGLELRSAGAQTYTVYLDDVSF